MAQPARRPLQIAGHPIYSALLPVPILCFVGALATDIVYSSAPEMMWLDFSSWLLLVGLIAGGIAGLVLLIELVRSGRGRSRAIKLHFVFFLAACLIEVFNSFIHTRDGWTAVVPTGLALSAAASLLALLAGWFWQSARIGQSGEAR